MGTLLTVVVNMTQKQVEAFGIWFTRIIIWSLTRCGAFAVDRLLIIIIINYLINNLNECSVCMCRSSLVPSFHNTSHRKKDIKPTLMWISLDEDMLA